MAGEKTVNEVTFRIRRTMILVKDLDRGIDFYTRLLGMRVQRLRPSLIKMNGLVMSTMEPKTNIPHRAD